MENEILIAEFVERMLDAGRVEELRVYMRVICGLLGTLKSYQRAEPLLAVIAAAEKKEEAERW